MQFQEQLELLKRELTVANKSARKSQSLNKELQKNVVQLQDEFVKKQYQMQANLRSIVDKFKTKTKAEIELTTATTSQTWTEQAAELQVLRADKTNWELDGPGFWKLDQANCEAVQKNLTTDFLRIALTHREEIAKLLERCRVVAIYRAYGSKGGGTAGVLNQGVRRVGVVGAGRRRVRGWIGPAFSLRNDRRTYDRPAPRMIGGAITRLP
jgi:hypothetical protein